MSLEQLADIFNERRFLGSDGWVVLPIRPIDRIAPGAPIIWRGITGEYFFHRQAEYIASQLS